MRNSDIPKSTWKQPDIDKWWGNWKDSPAPRDLLNEPLTNVKIPDILKREGIL